MTETSRRTSSQFATRLATGRRSGVSWLGDREVVKPMAPALSACAQLALHRAEIVLGRGLVEGALAHRIRAQRGVADVAGVVDALGQPVDGGEELRERGPRPVDARVHRLARDVLRALEISHDEMPVRLGARGEREAAIAHDHARHAVPARAGAEGVPEDLGVHVRMPVHESGRHHLAVGVDHLARGLPDAPDRRDPAPDDADVAPISGHAGSVDHHAVLDHQVIGHARLLSSQPFGIALEPCAAILSHLGACPPAAARQQLSAPPFFGRSISSTRTSSGAHMKQMRGPLGIWMGPSSSRAPSPSSRVMSASRPAESKPKCSRP